MIFWVPAEGWLLVAGGWSEGQQYLDISWWRLVNRNMFMARLMLDPHSWSQGFAQQGFGLLKKYVITKALFESSRVSSFFHIRYIMEIESDLVRDGSGIFRKLPRVLFGENSRHVRTSKVIVFPKSKLLNYLLSMKIPQFFFFFFGKRTNVQIFWNAKSSKSVNWVKKSIFWNHKLKKT